MQFFGLASLLITLVIASWWFLSNSSSVNSVKNEDGVVQESIYEQAIDSASDAVETVEKKSNTSIPVTKVEIYRGVSFSSNAKVVDISGRGYSGSLKAEIRQLSELRELYLSDNNFTGLPAEIGQLSRLEILDLSNNPLTGLPYELGNLKNLKTLDLRGTNYAEQDLAIIKQSLPISTVILTD